MKRFILFTICILSVSGLYAQNENPFAKYGYDVPVLTMTNGRFPEFHDRQEVVQIGSVLYNTKTKDIAGDVEIDTAVMWLEPHTVSRWITPDPLAEKYYSISPYVYCLNNPVNAIDPDGERVYFVAGAGNDNSGWNYVNRFQTNWTNAGISDFKRINASDGKVGDMLFSNNFRNQDYTTFNGMGTARVKSVTEFGVLNQAVSDMVTDLTQNGLQDGEQLNLAGYSYGAVLQEHAATQLIEKGFKIDNLILIGSPTSDDSPLMKQLIQYQEKGMIGQIIRYDIPGDKLSNPKNDVDYAKGAWQNRNDSGHHFDLARPGEEADRRQRLLGDMLKLLGVN